MWSEFVRPPSDRATEATGIETVSWTSIMTPRFLATLVGVRYGKPILMMMSI